MTLDRFLKLNGNGTHSRRKVACPKKTLKIRKYSAQLSIADWVIRKNLCQDNPLLSIGKFFMLQVFSFLNIEELLQVAKVCTYFSHCFHALWHCQDWLSEVNTGQLTPKEMNIVLRHTTSLPHLLVLKRLYLGRCFQSSREIVTLKTCKDQQMPGCVLSQFKVKPKRKLGACSFNDQQIKMVVETSKNSLRQISLMACVYFRDFTLISGCRELQLLSLTNNDFFETSHLAAICIKCPQLKILQLDSCPSLDCNAFQEIAKLCSLQSLSMQNFKQPFTSLYMLGRLGFMTKLNLSFSMVTDSEIIPLLRESVSLQNVVLIGKSASQFRVSSSH